MVKILLIVAAIIIVGILALVYFNSKQISQGLNFVNEKYSETQTIRSQVLKKYPNSDVAVQVNFVKSIKPGGGTTNSSQISILINSNKLLSESELKDVNEDICNLLGSMDKKYDIVGTKSSKMSYFPSKQFSIYTSSSSVRLANYCSDFSSK